jgi:CDP-diacylglycerol--glycerol-3-phosphate 3-phosphatidyltransferase
MWPNAVTIARIASIPAFLWFMFNGAVRHSSATTSANTWIAFVIFAVAAASDFLDGYLARRLDSITSLGQFLDPLADKLLVGAALVGLVALRDLPVWAAIVIVAREILVSALRTVGLRRGNSMPASFPGKVKTAIQIPMVLVWMMPRAGGIEVTQNIVMYLAVVLTVGSGILYFTKSKQLLARADGVAR